MPINITDEAFDALDKAPETERLKFFQGLSPEDRASVASAVPEWRKRKGGTPATVAPVQAPPPGPAQPLLQGPALKGPPSGLDLGGPTGPTGPVQQPPAPREEQPWENPGVLDYANHLKDTYAVPALRAAQKVGKVAVEPFLDMAGFGETPWNGQISTANMPENLLLRQGLSAIAGPEVLSEMTDRDRLQATNSLIDAVGETGAAFAQAGASFAGDPTMYIPMGVSGKVSKVLGTVAPALAKYPALLRITGHVLGAATEGGIQHLAKGAVSEAPVQETLKTLPKAMAFAGGMGGGIAAAGEAAPFVAAKSKMIGIAASDFMKNLFDDVGRLEHDGESVFFTSVKAKTAPAPPAEPVLTLATVVKKDDGKLYGRLLKTGRTGQQWVEDFPADTSEEAGAFYAKSQKENATFGLGRDAILAVSEKPAVYAEFLLSGRKLGGEGEAETPTTTRGTVNTRTPKAVKALDEPPPSPESRPQIVVARNGRATMQPSEPPADPQPGNFGVGDHVVIHDSEGLPTVGVLKRFTEDGRAVVEPLPVKSNGERLRRKLQYAETHQLRAASSAEVEQGLATASHDPAAFADTHVPEKPAPPVPDDTGKIEVAKPTDDQMSDVLSVMQSRGSASARDVRHILGVDLRTAHAVLGELAAQGHAREFEPGNFEASGGGGGKLPPPGKPAGPPPEPGRGDRLPFKTEGEKVYLLGRNGQDVAAEFVGMAGKGQARVKLTPGSEPITVPVEKLRSTLPPGIANIKQLAPDPVPAGPPPNLGDMDKSTIEGINTISQLVRKFASQGEAGVDKVLRPILNARFRGPVDLQDKIRSLQAIKELEATRNDVYHALRSSFKDQKLFSQFDKDLGSVAEGKLPVAHMEKYGEGWQRGKELVKRLLQERDQWDRLIADLGGIPEHLIDLRDAGLVDRYVARMYWSHVNPKEWAKRVPQNVMDDAIAFLMKQKENVYTTETAVADELHKIITSGDPVGNWKVSPLSKPFNKLKGRQDIPAPIRAAMGEIESGIYRLSTSLGSQRAIAANLTAWRGIAQNPEYFSPGPRMDTQGRKMIQVPDNPKYYGDAAGGYVTKDIYDAIINLPAAIERGPSTVRALTGWVKMNEVALGGLGSHINSLMGNIKSCIYAGGIDPLLHPLEAGRTLKEAVTALRSYAKDPTGSGAGAVILEARRVGSDWTGFNAQEASSRSEKVLRDLDDILGKMPRDSDALSILSAVNRYTLNVAKKGGEHLGALLDAQDRFFRVANYIGLRRKFLAQGMNLEDAAKLASDRVNKSFWNTANTAPVVDKLRKGSVGLFAKYLTPFAEDVRIDAMLPKRILEESDLRHRLLAYGVLGAGLYGAHGVMQRMNGINPEDVEAAEASVTKRQKWYKPMLTSATWHDSQGRIQFWDGSNWFLPLKLMQGHPDDAMWRRVMGNFIMGPFEGGAMEPLVRKYMESAGLVRQQPQPRPLIEGEADAVHFMQDAWNAGLGPKVITKTWDALRKGGVVGQLHPNEEKFTPGQMAGKMMGLPVVGGVTDPVGEARSPSRAGAGMETAREILELQSQLKQAVMMKRMDLIPAIQKRIAEIGAQAQQRGQIYQRAQQGRGGQQ